MWDVVAEIALVDNNVNYGSIDKACELFEAHANMYTNTHQTESKMEIKMYLILNILLDKYVHPFVGKINQVHKIKISRLNF